MMQIFSHPGDKTKPAAVAGRFASNLICVGVSPLLTDAIIAVAAPAILQISGHRNSNLNMIGAALL